jgi:two-component system sensor histidine kinase/response regulator
MKLFIALLAHDLKNAFASVLVGTRLLAEEMAGLELSQARILAAELRGQSERSYRLLEELLAWARCGLEEEGRGAGEAAGEAREAEPRPGFSRVELEPLVRGALLLYELPAASRGLELKAELEPGAAVLSDRNLVSAPLRNLVANAVRLSRPGGEVAVRARSEGAQIVLEVSDTGPGIRQDLRPGRLSGSPPPFGSGMGLFLAAEFARLAGGSLEGAASPGGEGATFTLRLPKG